MGIKIGIIIVLLARADAIYPLDCGYLNEKASCMTEKDSSCREID